MFLVILENGIDVYTTLNVQHIESRSDTVKQITGTTIREMVPDSILDHADEIELVDITPEEFIKAFSGKEKFIHLKVLNRQYKIFSEKEILQHCVKWL